MRYDYKQLYEKNAAFYERHPIAKKLLLFSNTALTGIFFLAYGVFLVYAYFHEYTLPDFVKIVEFPVLCLFLVSVLRTAIDRERPYSEKGANIEPILQKSGKQNKSFPSRHTACAFVISTVILAYMTGAGICLIVLGCVLGYVRFALGVHYPTDLLGGAVLGGICGLLLLI